MAYVIEYCLPDGVSSEFLRGELLELVEVAQGGTEEARRAIGFPMSDLEDALQAAAALAFKAAFVVTRNVYGSTASP